MLTTIEKIIEALTYAEDEDCSWIEYFESPEEAKDVIEAAQKINIDDIEECELAYLTESLGIDLYEIAKEIAFEDCISILKEDLNDDEYTD